MKKSLAVVGAGSWGTALAQVLAAKGFVVDLWAFEPEVVEGIQNQRENPIFLAGVPLSERIRASSDPRAVVEGKDFILFVVPSEFLRSTARTMAPFVSPDALVVSAAKGIEVGTHLRMTQVLAEELPQVDPARITAISGPSFAREAAMGLPTLVTVAAPDPVVGETVQQIFASPAFRVYTNEDMVGVELGGAVKNVMAIASGICDGLGLGANTRAALITRGLAEMRRLGLAMGALPETFSGLAGVGDLVLTCTADQSRNYTVGKKIGSGAKLSEILSGMRMVAEGVRTAKSVFALSQKLNVEMPIVEQTYEILYQDKDPGEAIFTLMTRKLKNELAD
ncbi:MAG: NAD(P)-dependent glycerol-3-phosphate dehydrogenase [Proteobacteria bacterium]|nr:NAD(P)-dependent glycerol-3-phosphate dehydrogenase [Pseudomonadota bacterium]